MRLLAPRGSLEVNEEAWNCFPFVQTTISVGNLSTSSAVLLNIYVANAVILFQNPGFMREDFHITITTIHIGNDSGSKDNVSGTALVLV